MCNRGVPQLYNFRFTPISPDAFTLSFAYIGCSYDIHSPILPLWTSVSAAPCVLHKALRQPHGLLAIASVYPVRFGCWALAGLGCASAGWAWASACYPRTAGLAGPTPGRMALLRPQRSGNALAALHRQGEPVSHVGRHVGLSPPLNFPTCQPLPTRGPGGNMAGLMQVIPALWALFSCSSRGAPLLAALPTSDESEELLRIRHSVRF